MVRQRLAIYKKICSSSALNEADDLMR